MSRILPFALAVAFSALPVGAALNGNAVTLNVTQASKQSTTINSRRSDGMKDRTITKVQTLDIECKTLGGTASESATVRWFFISKDALEGKFEYHSIGSSDVVLNPTKPAKVSAVGDPMDKDQFVQSEGNTRIQVTAATLPVGWVVMLVQNGMIVKQTASTPGLVEWMGRNPPPKPKSKK